MKGKAGEPEPKAVAAEEKKVEEVEKKAEEKKASHYIFANTKVVRIILEHPAASQEFDTHGHICRARNDETAT